MCSGARAVSCSALGPPLLLDTAPVLTDRQHRGCLQDELSLPFAPAVWAIWGLLAASCARLCLMAFLPSDRQTNLPYTRTQHGVCSGGSLQGWHQCHTFCWLCHSSGGLSNAVCASMRWHGHVGEKGPCQTSALLGTDWVAARKMRDFQGQLCFANPVIMPLKILIVLAMVNCELRHGEAWKESALLRAGRAGAREAVFVDRSNASG